MNGGICQLSTETFTSVRGWLILKTDSSAFHFPFRPVICSMRLVSRLAAFEVIAQSNANVRARHFRFMATPLESLEAFTLSRSGCQLPTRNDVEHALAHCR